jgi:transcriptional regulator with XRE-family HTH domain
MSDTRKKYYADDLHMSRAQAKNALCVAFGQYLRKLRGEMSITEFAAVTGMSRGHLSELEHGKREPGLLTIQTIAGGLGLSISALMRGVERSLKER